MAPSQQRRGAAGGGQQQRKITLAVVGDVHTQWDADSEAALLSLGADVAVFVGDFGEETVQLVERVAAVPAPKAVILGNHDAWFSLTPNGRRRYARAMLAGSLLSARHESSEGGSTPAIARQLEALGDDHVGYSAKRFPALGLTLLGGRPFSKGGKRWSDVADFYEEHFGIGSMQDSALRILDVALGAHPGDCKVLVAHNGPSGLGARRHSVCGVDWQEPEADHGDPDLQEALDMAHKQGLRIPLVLFGHMHSQLKGRGERNMVEVDRSTGTVYLNAAQVPRIRSFPSTGGSGGGGGARLRQPHESSYEEDSAGEVDEAAAGSSGDSGSMRGHHFLVVELQLGIVTAARDVWVGVQPGGAAGGAGRRCVVLQQQELLKTSLPAAALGGTPGADGASGDGSSGGGTAGEAAAQGSSSGGGTSGDEYVCSIYRAFTGEWEPLVLPLPEEARQAGAA